MSRTVRWEPRARRDIQRLQPKLRARIVAAVDRFAATEVGHVKALRGLDEHRLRVGDWRVRIELDGDVLWVLRVLPRGDAYKR